MEKDDQAGLPAENARLSDLIVELEKELHILTQAAHVETLILNREVERLSKLGSFKRKALPGVDGAGKKLKKEDLKCSGHAREETLEYGMVRFSSTDDVDPSMPTGKKSDIVASMELEARFQIVKSDETDVWTANARLSDRVTELEEEIHNLTEATFAEILKSTSEVESGLKSAQKNGQVLWNDDETRTILRYEKAKVFFNLPDYRIPYKPINFVIGKKSIVDCLRKKITRPKIPFQKIYEVDNVFRIHPEMIAEELPPYWYFFTRPGGLINRDDSFKKTFTSGIWKQLGRMRKINRFDPVGIMRIYVCGNWRLTLYRLQLSMEAEPHLGYETGWAFAIMEKDYKPVENVIVIDEY